jgi:hypothetical protein
MSLSLRCIFTLFFFLLAAPMLWAQSAKTSIIIERQLVRFITPGEAVEWRLIVANQPGELIFDSGPVYGSALDWPLKNQQGEAVASGLYTYTLTSKAATEETARTQRGHLMLARPSDNERIWITNDQSASIGADSSAVKLSVIGSGETTVGGAELPGSVPRREVSAERPESPLRATADATVEKAATPAVVNGTANRVVKFAADGSSLVDSALTEVGGNVGIGTTSPAAGFDYRGSTAAFFTRDIGTTNLGTAQSALQLGVSNLHARNVGVGPSMLFFGENSAGNKSFLGRVSAVWENPMAGAEAGALFFQVRANSGDASALTERMRITANGNVGIGTPSPTSRLEIAAQDGLKISGYQPFFTLRDASTGRSSYLQGINGDLVLIPQSFAGCCAAMVIKNFSGNVGIGTGTPAHRLSLIGGPTWTANGWTGALELGNASAIGWQANAVGNRFGIGQTNGGLYFFATSSDPGTTGDPAIYGMVITDNGHITQARDKGGLVKAMIYVDPFLPASQYIVRCYNGVTSSSTGNCGFSMVRDGTGIYRINFGFQINDRFFSLSLNQSGATGSVNVNATNEIVIVTHLVYGSAERVDTRFYVIVY